VRKSQKKQLRTKFKIIILKVKKIHREGRNIKMSGKGKLKRNLKHHYLKTINLVIKFEIEEIIKEDYIAAIKQPTFSRSTLPIPPAFVLLSSSIFISFI
jgi:hypothetical protein